MMVQRIPPLYVSLMRLKIALALAHLLPPAAFQAATYSCTAFSSFIEVWIAWATSSPVPSIAPLPGDAEIPTADRTSITASTTMLAYCMMVAQSMSLAAASWRGGLKIFSSRAMSSAQCFPSLFFVMSMRKVGRSRPPRSSFIRLSGKCLRSRCSMSSGRPASSLASVSCSVAADLAASTMASFSSGRATSFAYSSGAYYCICSKVPSTAFAIISSSVAISALYETSEGGFRQFISLLFDRRPRKSIPCAKVEDSPQYYKSVSLLACTPLKRSECSTLLYLWSTVRGL